MKDGSAITTTPNPASVRQDYHPAGVPHTFPNAPERHLRPGQNPDQIRIPSFLVLIRQCRVFAPVQTKSDARGRSARRL
jgi:hypothetical protein